MSLQGAIWQLAAEVALAERQSPEVALPQGLGDLDGDRVWTIANGIERFVAAQMSDKDVHIIWPEGFE